MKKLLLILGLVLAVGVGCTPKEEPADSVAEVPSVPSPTPTPSPAPTPTPEPTPQPELDETDSEAPSDEPTLEDPEPVEGSTGLAALPTFTSPTTPIDDSEWETTTTRAGITLTYPIKGSYAPLWEYARLSSGDPRLKGTCLVTADAKYQKTDFSPETACQTTTAFAEGAGTRTDYFVIKNGENFELITFTKTHPENFNMNDYSATLDHALRLIKFAP